MKSRILCAMLALFTAISLSGFGQVAKAACIDAGPYACVPGFKPPPSPYPQYLGPIYPDFYLLTILYAPPGNDSEVQYGAGSTTGTHTETTRSYKYGEKIEFETTLLSLSGSFEIGHKGGTSIETKKETTSILKIKGANNAIDHSKDTFFLWMNPQVDVTQTGVDSFHLSWHPHEESMLIVPVTVEELQGRATIPDWKQVYFARLTERDREQILSMNPFLPVPAPAVQPPRFQSPLLPGASFPPVPTPAVQSPRPQEPRFVRLTDQQLQLDGPDHPGDPLIGMGVEVSNEHIKGMIMGDVQSISSEALVGGKLSLFGLFEASTKVGVVFDYDYESITEQTSGTVQKIEVTLGTTTVGYHDVIDIYEDTLFRSFVFVSVGRFSSGSEVLRGMVTDRRGQPVDNQRVLVHLPDGVTRTVFTNQQGMYRVFGAPVGIAVVEVNGTFRTVRIEAGKTNDASMSFGW